MRAGHGDRCPFCRGSSPHQLALARPQERKVHSPFRKVGKRLNKETRSCGFPGGRTVCAGGTYGECRAHVGSAPQITAQRVLVFGM